MFKARTHALELGLNMKLSDVEYQGDKRKAIFYYTAEDRVDFRELIKKLADEFKVRVEMKQIGYRQEAGRLGAIGSCGRELCCSTWLTDFKMVHINAARYQNLSINQLKLSGQCGKLKCCLNFELDVYQESLKDFPEKDNNIIEFAGDLRYKQVKIDILKRILFFAPMGEANGDWLELSVEKAKEYISQNRDGVKPELVIKPKVELKKVIELDFKNDMGMDSLTRLDDNKKRNNNNKNNRNKNNKPNTNAVQGNNPNQNRQAQGTRPVNTNPNARPANPNQMPPQANVNANENKPSENNIVNPHQNNKPKFNKNRNNRNKPNLPKPDDKKE
jgi:hypothetical protein